MTRGYHEQSHARANPDLRVISAKGHSFGADLECKWCGYPWEMHQSEQTECQSEFATPPLKPRAKAAADLTPRARTAAPPPSADVLRLRDTLAEHKIQFRTIAREIGFTEQMVQRALGAGRYATAVGMVSEVRREAVCVAAREMLRARGVEVGEGPK